MVIMTLARLSLLLLLQQPEASASEFECGFPGTPAFGFVNPDTDAYEEGTVVTYSCRVGYILIGTPIRRCKEDGTWTGEIPICDDSMTTLGTASSTPAVPGHPPELAIDRDKDTCTYLSPKDPRWWRIDLGGVYKVLSVAVTMASPDKFVKFTVFVIKIQGTNASYKRCASFTGKFGTSTVLLSCAEGKGIEGQRVHIEDHMKTDGLFDICEVEVQVEKDTGYECGRPDRKLNSVTFEPENGEVDYGCKIGYEIVGRSRRYCLDTGQWDGEPPECEAIVCDPLPPLENGEMKLRLINGESPLEGTIANYKCDEGYRLIGDFSRICLKDGSWSGREPHCEAVRCGVPDGKELGGIFRLVNRTTRMGSMAILKCRKGKREGDDPYIICSEDGEWTEAQARCLIPARSAVAKSDGPRIVNKGAIIFGMVVAAVMVAIVLVSLYVVFQRRRNANKPELPSRQSGAPEAPPRPPPRSKVPLASTLIDYVTRDSKPAKPEQDADKNESLWKTRSLPTRTEENHEWQAEVAPNRATSLDQQLSSKEPEGEKAPEVSTADESAAETNKDATVDKPAAAETAKDENANEQAEVPTKEETTEEEKASDTAATPTPSREYAAVDYEKKRESRLKKGQKDEEKEEDESEKKAEERTGVNDESASPEVPPKSVDLEEGQQKGVEKQSEQQATEAPAAEKPSTPEPKPEEEKPTGTGRRRTRLTAEAEQPAAETAQPRRMRWRAEPTEEPEEPRFSRTRRTREREK